MKTKSFTPPKYSGPCGICKKHISDKTDSLLHVGLGSDHKVFYKGEQMNGSVVCGKHQDGQRAFDWTTE